METTRKKNVLITVRDTTSCSQGTHFVSSFFKNKKELMLTLFYVMQRPTSDQSMMDPWAEENSVPPLLPTEIKKAFTLCSNVLLKKGFSDDQIQKIARKKQSGTVQDILKEGRTGLYDAVVLGKRSTSLLENILNGNIGHEVLEKELSSPLWFCRDPDETRHNVLLCLDGSIMGEKLADHVGYILQNEEHHTITLFYVDKGQNVDQKKVFMDATTVLKSYGIPDERIKRSVVKSMRVVNSILHKAEHEKFAAIAIGSVGRTAKKRIYDSIIGTKCKNLFNEINKTALWIVP